MYQRMNLSERDRKILLEIARDTIHAVARGMPLPAFSVDSPALEEERGVFVTIHTREGRLRGCIGVFQSNKPLYETVLDMAVAAAKNDPRFSPVRADELPNIRIEISVLSPLKRITGVEEIEVGKHGIYLVKGSNRGVLLPQVATEHEFDRYEFLDQTCLKAGLPPGAWREEGVDIYVFEAEIFEEK